MKSFHRDTFELPRRIQVWDNFQNITPRQYKNFHLGHFILHGNTSLSLRTLSFQRLSITFLKYFLLCFIALWSYFTTYFYIGLQFSDFFFHCETIRNRCLAQLTESLTVHILPAPPPRPNQYVCWYTVMPVRILGSLYLSALIFSPWEFWLLVTRWLLHFQFSFIQGWNNRKSSPTLPLYPQKEVLPHFLPTGQPQYTRSITWEVIRKIKHSASKPYWGWRWVRKRGVEEAR